MADVNKQVSVSFKAIDNMTRVINGIEQDMKALKKQVNSTTEATEKGGKATKNLERSFTKASVKAQLFVGALKGLGNIVAGVAKGMFNLGKRAISSATSYMKDALATAQQYEVSLKTLGIVVTKGIKNQQKANKISKAAQDAAKELGKELRIGPVAAADGLQNLMNSGLGLKKAKNLMRRFTNEAITGKSANISLEQAVMNLAFAYKTGNSALGNMSGMSENWIDIEKKGAKIMGKKLKDMTEAEKAMARYKGTIQLTDLTLGSSEKVLGSYAKMQANVNYATSQLKINIGQGLNVALGVLSDTLMPSVDAGMESMLTGIEELREKITKWWKTNQEFIEPQLQRIADAFGGLKDKVMSLFAPLNTSQEEFNKLANQALQNTVDKIVEIIGKIEEFIGWLSSPEGKKAVKGFAQDLKTVARAAGQIAQAITDAANALENFRKEGSKIDSSQSAFGGFAGVKGSLRASGRKGGGGSFAQGTSFFSGGMATVGEQGPENVILPRGSKIMSNRKSGGNGGMTINVNAPVYGVDNLVATITQAVNEANSQENKLANYNLL